jgi:hypothetical protein
MSFYHTINYYGDKPTKQKAKEINERRRQAQAFLRRNSEQKKKPSISTKDASQCSHPTCLLRSSSGRGISLVLR